MRLNRLDQVLAGEPTTDVVRVTSYRSDLFGRAFIDGLHEVLRGPSDWSAGERELFAAFVSHTNSCQF